MNFKSQYQSLVPQEIAPWHNKKLLVIDDDKISVQLIEEIFHPTEIRLTSCTEYDDAISKIRNSKKYDLIIFNFLPNQELSLNLLNLIAEKAANTPVILTSSIPYPLISNVLSGIHGTIKHFMLKPLLSKELLEVAETCLQ
jgi:DNA-binding NtrC family response regulator